MRSEPDGSVIAYTDQGFYYRDPRYISNYEFYADGEHWILQNSGAIAYYAHPDGVGRDRKLQAHGPGEYECHADDERRIAD